MSGRTGGTAVVAGVLVFGITKVYLTPFGHRPPHGGMATGACTTRRIATSSAAQPGFHAATVGRQALGIGERRDVGGQRREVGLGEPDHAPAAEELVG